MIPYDDLVVALAAWRARQGLPVAQPAGAPPAPPAPSSRAPAPSPPAARTAPPSAPARTAPPAAKPAQVAPVQSGLHDFDEGEGGLGEDGAYDAGDDFAVPFGAAVLDQAGEATAIGGAPEPPTEGLLVPKRGKRNPDW